MKTMFESALEPFYYMNKAITSDSQGGQITIWSEGAELLAVVAYPEQTTGDIADALTSKMNCFIYTHKDITLEPMQVIKRKRDGLTFRVLTFNAEEETPSKSTLNMRRVKAERWEIPVSV